MDKNYCNLKYTENIKFWDEGLPLGNGDMGCLIWGDGNKLRFSIDKGDLWDISGATKAGGDFTYSNLQKLVSNKKIKKISKIFDAPYAKSTPTKLPVGKIIIELYESNLDLAKLNIFEAQAKIKIKDIVVESFIHAEKSVGFIKINKKSLAIKLLNPNYGIKGNIFPFKRKGKITQSLKNLKYERAKSFETRDDEIDFKYFTQKINDTMTYGLFVASINIGLSTYVVYTISIGKNQTETILKGKNLLKSILAEGYENNCVEHMSWWKNFWEKSYINLPDKFLEKKWYMTNYLLGSCSREGFSPMPLQGVWTADNGSLPPWKGDYHFDLNTQLSYLSYLKANHLESGKSYIDFLLKHQSKAEKFAQDFYNAKGLCLPSVMDIEANPLGGWPMYSLSPTNQAWLCHGIKEYCDYANEDVFLREKAYNYMKKYGEFLISILKEKNGKLKLPLSSSPETHDNTLKSWLTPNSNYDIAMMLRHFTNLIIMAEQLDFQDDIKIWQEIIAKIEPLAIDKDNVLMLSSNERQTGGHRHFSHLIAIYPLKIMPYNENYKEIIEASINDLEKLGTREYCGYSFAWLANLYAIQKNGNKAIQSLHTFWKDFCLENVFHINGDYKKSGKSVLTYRLFTVEGNFCAAEALQNLLLQCENGSIEIFPSISKDWENVDFKLLACRGVLVTSKIARGKLEIVKLEAKTATEIELIYNNNHINITINSNEGFNVSQKDINFLNS